MSYLRDDTYDYATNLDSVYGEVRAYRWANNRPGMWFAMLDFPDLRFIAVDCVVDDFGSLVPVSCHPHHRIKVL